MALPSSIDPSTPAGSESIGLGDDRIRALKQFIIDAFGVPADPTQIANALFTVIAGGLRSVNFQNAGADPVTVGFLQRDGTRLKYHDGTSAKSIATTADITAGFGGSFTDLAGTIALAQIANDLITYAKLQNVSAASRLLGRGSASGSGDAQELTVGSGLLMSGTTLSVVAPTPTAPQEATFALSIDTGESSNSLAGLYLTVNTINQIVVRTKASGFSGGTGGKGGSPSSSNTVNQDSAINHNIGRIQNVTPSLVITSGSANPFVGTLKVAYS